MGLLQWATEDQKQRFLVPQAKGEKIACFGLTESGAGSDVVALESTARRQGDEFVLNGEKMWISLATKAHHALWVGRTNPEAADPHAGLSAFIVELDRPGVTTGDLHGKLGMRAGSTGWLSFQDVRVPAGNLLGEEGEGFKIAMSCLDNGRYTVAAGATGLIRASLEASIRYAKDRRTFGREIARYQLVQQKIARMVQSYEMARLLYLRAGWMKNKGLRNTRETSLSKWFATDASFDAANEAIQVHGAYGYSDEYDVERYMRNSRGAVIYEGTSEIHQLMQAGYALGYRTDTPLRRELPAYDVDFWQAEG
jgi:alkylation response protein AidB-like acyl-CoA dehydrogenase